MKKLLLLPLVGLVAAGCSTTEYYQDDLAVAQMLNDDAAPQEHIQRVEQLKHEQMTLSRAEFEQSRALEAVQEQLDEIDSRISALESDMGTMAEAEQEQVAEEISDLRAQQRRAESMLRDAGQRDAVDFVEVRDELRNAVNALEIGIYRVMVRDSAEPAPGQTIQ